MENYFRKNKPILMDVLSGGKMSLEWWTYKENNVLETKPVSEKERKNLEVEYFKDRNGNN